jgi:hypothetical protein
MSLARICRENQWFTPHAYIIGNIDFGPDAIGFLLKRTRGEEVKAMTSMLTQEEVAMLCRIRRKGSPGSEDEEDDAHQSGPRAPTGTDAHGQKHFVDLTGETEETGDDGVAAPV